MNGMSIEQDGRECRVVMASSGRVVAIFDGGSAATNRRHAEQWVTGTFCRDAYESDLAHDHEWDGKHVLHGFRSTKP